MTAADDVPDPYDAVVTSNIAALDALADAFPDFPVDGEGPDNDWLDIAIGVGAAESVRWLIAKGVDVSARGPDGYTLLLSTIETATTGRERILHLLIEAGADVNGHGIQDWTPLHMAAVRDDFEAMRILLGAGADRSVRTRIDDCATPEEEARNLGHHRSADFIRDYRR